MTNKKQTRLHHKARHHAKMALVPHRKNQYRPHLIRRYGMASVLLVVAMLLGGYNIVTTGSVLGDRPVITTQGLLAATNQVRSSYGTQELELNDTLSEAAKLKAQDMFQQQYWAHVAPDGTEPWQWFDKVGYVYSDAGENLARNFMTSQSIVAAWMNSQTHRDNVLNSEYTQVGFSTASGILDGKQTQITVALYAKPLADQAVAGVSMGSDKIIEAPVGTSVSLATRVGYALQTMSPAALTSFLLLTTVAFVAFIAHAYRKKLPRPLQRSWYRHHGLYKGVGTMALVVVIVALYGGGQI